jgi:hypothetical protein
MRGASSYVVVRDVVTSLTQRHFATSIEQKKKKNALKILQKN